MKKVLVLFLMINVGLATHCNAMEVVSKQQAKYGGNTAEVRARLIAAIDADDFAQAQKIVTYRRDVVNVYTTPCGGNAIVPLVYAACIERETYKCDPDNYIRMLLRAGANPNATDKDGNTLLHMYRVLTPERLALLWKYDADTNKQNKFGHTPLLSNVRANNERVVRYLVAGGAELDIQDDYGETALHNAFELGLFKIADLLVSAGARVDICNEEGKTPVDLLLYPEKPHYLSEDALKNAYYNQGMLFVFNGQLLFENNGHYLKKMLAKDIKALAKQGRIDKQWELFFIALQVLIKMSNSAYEQYREQMLADQYTRKIFDILRECGIWQNKEEVRLVPCKNGNFCKIDELMSKAAKIEKSNKWLMRKRIIKELLFTNTWDMNGVD